MKSQPVASSNGFRHVMQRFTFTSEPGQPAGGSLTYEDITRLLTNMWSNSRAMPDTPDFHISNGDVQRLYANAWGNSQAMPDNDQYTYTYTSSDHTTAIPLHSASVPAPRQFEYPVVGLPDVGIMATRIGELQRQVDELNEQLGAEQQEKHNLHGLLGARIIEVSKLLGLLERVPRPDNWEDGTLLEEVINTLADYRRRGALPSQPARE